MSEPQRASLVALGLVALALLAGAVTACSAPDARHSPEAQALFALVLEAHPHCDELARERSENWREGAISTGHDERRLEIEAVDRVLSRLVDASEWRGERGLLEEAGLDGLLDTHDRLCFLSEVPFDSYSDYKLAYLRLRNDFRARQAALLETFPLDAEARRGLVADFRREIGEEEARILDRRARRELPAEEEMRRKLEDWHEWQAWEDERRRRRERARREALEKARAERAGASPLNDGH